MGWDAYATKNDEIVNINWNLYNSDKRPELTDPVLKVTFEKAAQTVRELAEDKYDWMLSFGGLACSDCARMLEKATGIDTHPIDDSLLSSEQVKNLHKKANWEFAAIPLWAYWSARKFLEVCAKHNLGMQFSW